jgi:hypothetical protein
MKFYFLSFSFVIVKIQKTFTIFSRIYKKFLIYFQYFLGPCWRGGCGLENIFIIFIYGAISKSIRQSVDT